MTGSWSTPDYLHFLPPGTHYRVFAPGCACAPRWTTVSAPSLGVVAGLAGAACRAFWRPGPTEERVVVCAL